MEYKGQWIRMALGLLMLASTGCSAQETGTKTAEISQPATTDLFVKNDNLQTVYFENGQTKLDGKGFDIAKKNLEWLRPNLPMHIEVAGYSDGQGSPEQNLAVGQRRAAALRDFYVSMGIPRSRISTVTLGGEDPTCYDDSDTCRAANRRAETRIENKSLALR